MPSYDYRCDDCGHRFAVLIAWRDRDKVTCPECQSKNVTQLMTGFSFLGSPGGSCNTGGHTRFG